MRLQTGYDAQQPGQRGLGQLTSTWSGRILLVNSVMFIAISLTSGSIMVPTDAALDLYGVKDPVALVNGEYWRLFTPMFLHIGVIHFGMNSLMLHLIGSQLEQLIGKRWFLAIYLLSGIGGNIASAAFSVAKSAGASGAIFGLLGCGFFIERAIGKKIYHATGQRQARGAYAMTIMVNVVLGFLVPFIDNAAHLGGLAVGFALTFAMTNLRPNQLLPQRPAVGWITISATIFLLVIGALVSLDKNLVKARLVQAADKAQHNHQALEYYNKGIAIDPEDSRIFFKRGKLLLYAGELRYALSDLQIAAADKALARSFDQLIDDLRRANLTRQAELVTTIVEGTR